MSAEDKMRNAGEKVSGEIKKVAGKTDHEVWIGIRHLWFSSEARPARRSPANSRVGIERRISTLARPAGGREAPREGRVNPLRARANNALRRPANALRARAAREER